MGLLPKEVSTQTQNVGSILSPQMLSDLLRFSSIFCFCFTTNYLLIVTLPFVGPCYVFSGFYVSYGTTMATIQKLPKWL